MTGPIKTSRAPLRVSAGGGGPYRFDPRQRQAAAHIQDRNPHWLICWGCHSRIYWAYPLFGAPPGTIISAPDEPRLLADMRQAEAKVAARPADA